MKKVCKQWKCWGLLLGLMLFAAGFAMHATTVETQAAANGFRTVSGRTYYYRNGQKVKGLQRINNKYYYFASKTGEMLRGWFKSSTGHKRYFDKSTGQMKTGLRYVEGEYYYFDFKSGWAKSGFQKLNGSTRYYKPGSFAMAKGWMKNSKNQKWYFDRSNGRMAVGLQKIDGKFYYFYSKTGAAQSGFIKFGTGTRYFFGNGNYSMAKGWVTSNKNEKRYFNYGNGLMCTGKTKISGKWYYFSYRNGVAGGGWLVEGKNKRFFDRKTLVMVTGTRVIDGVTYTFGPTGLLLSSSEDEIQAVTPTAPSSARTVKNYLLNALQPVGRTLYMWGGGHNSDDATRKGISPRWTQFYASQNSSYDYERYKDLSTANRQKGLDCSGYVGWATYQVMQARSGVGGGYTVVSGEIGGLYKSLGFGTAHNQAYLQSKGYKLYPGDIGYDDGHTWIYLGQCRDKSAVILHSTPNAGVQISGTPTPNGNYSSQAIALAKKYMAKYPGYQRMGSSFYHTSAGNYVRRGYLFRWNTSVLKDPEGYRYKTADQILADLFR